MKIIVYMYRVVLIYLILSGLFKLLYGVADWQGVETYTTIGWRQYIFSPYYLVVRLFTKTLSSESYISTIIITVANEFTAALIHHFKKKYWGSSISFRE